ncbi:hypothetical protein AVEN_67221-1, partial [Araneus ventricosus]
KLDESLRKQWELSLDSEKFPTYDDLVSFIEKHARSIRNANSDHLTSRDCISRNIQSRDMNKYSAKKNTVVHNTVVNNSTRNKCILCSENHPIYKCGIFNGYNLEQRWNVIKTMKLCNNCLKSNHDVSKCMLSVRCKNCSLKHHTLLHDYSKNYKPLAPPSQNVPTLDRGESSSATSLSYSGTSDSGNILLCTAIVKV